MCEKTEIEFPLKQCAILYTIYILCFSNTRITKKLKRITTTTTLIMTTTTTTRKHGKDEAKLMMMMRNKEKTF